ncbi:COX15/CtaA family protein [Halomonas daqiaonensis]|uniref:Cytochrome c oxidase assembly protein subunit 15 n=1 Tax=Halomonas daqiaonensis TaxID=650850 RepID=A0A1H7FYV4_9GAMM|nr:COX15/CtaA family protein [Halomonas daqiaonensis]SEK28605.1 cytochrome c oxidase assembly protein subunit 15 [Halomonas daqiaonensis]
MASSALAAGEDSRLRWLVRLSLAGVVFTAVVVLVGAWTRLVDAGLGCPDWPGCYGALVVPDADRALAHSPEVPLESAKAWVEMIHRYLASTLGLVVIALVVLGARWRREVGYPWVTSLALLAVILLQGAFGAFTVTLKLWPQVVTLHLLGGLTVMVLFLWLHLRLRRFSSGAGRAAPPPRRLTPLWGGAILLLVGQLALGGWTSSNYAGIACQGFPTCNGQWWPTLDWSEGFHLTQTVGPNYLHGQLHAEARSAIQVGHRLGALALGLSLLVLAIRYLREAGMRSWLALLVGTYAFQVVIGIANVLAWLPLWLALLHTAGAVLLVVAMTLALWHWRWSKIPAAFALPSSGNNRMKGELANV